MQSDTLHVHMNGTLVGSLKRLSAHQLAFQYDATWLSAQGARPLSLSLPLVETTHTSDAVYHYFDNLLPDSQAVRTRIQTMFGAANTQPFELLYHIGRDCVGAIQLTPSTPPTNTQLSKMRLNESDIESILHAAKNSSLGMQDTDSDFRISIAGAQEKTALLWHEQTWCRPIGNTPTTHIFKLPIGYLPHQEIDLSHSLENEWLCAKIIEAFGLPVANTTLAHFGKVKTLIVERFDRSWSADHTQLLRLPQEDLCQAFGISPNLKYEADGGPGIVPIMQLLKNSSQVDKDLKNFFQSQVVFYLLAAIDGHAKNFSIALQPGGGFQLTPLYDVISAHPLVADRQLQEQKLKMAMALAGKNKHYRWHRIQRRHFLSTAETAQYDTSLANDHLEEVLLNTAAAIEEVQQKIPSAFPEKLAADIFAGMLTARDKLNRQA